jgi:hypothetical protein
MKNRDTTPNRRDQLDEDLALKLAETTDLSPNQAKRLIERYGHDPEKLMEAAKNFKAEG